MLRCLIHWPNCLCRSQYFLTLQLKNLFKNIFNNLLKKPLLAAACICYESIYLAPRLHHWTLASALAWRLYDGTWHDMVSKLTLSGVDAPDVTPIVIGPAGSQLSISTNSPCCKGNNLDDQRTSMQLRVDHKIERLEGIPSTYD